MKKLILLLIISSYGFCFAMNTMPGIDQHPYWPETEYQKAAQDCFSHLDNLQKKYAVKAFCEGKKINWKEMLNPSISFHHPSISFHQHNEVFVSKEDKLLIESKFFFIKWDNPELFITRPLTDNGHENTVLLRIFFKDFTFQVLDLYYKARNQIIQKIDATYVYKDEDDVLIQALYPTKTERIQALLKEALALNDALLKCFDTP